MICCYRTIKFTFSLEDSSVLKNFWIDTSVALYFFKLLLLPGFALFLFNGFEFRSAID